MAGIHRSDCVKQGEWILQVVENAVGDHQVVAGVVWGDPVRELVDKAAPLPGILVIKGGCSDIFGACVDAGDTAVAIEPEGCEIGSA